MHTRHFYILILYILLFLLGCKDQKAEKKSVHGNTVNSTVFVPSKTEIDKSAPEFFPEEATQKDTLTTGFISNTIRQSNIGILLTGPAKPLYDSVFIDNLKNNPVVGKPGLLIGEPTTSLNRYFLVDFDNDIFTNTDYYFTNGIQISVIAPVFQHFGVNKVLPGLGKDALNYYGAGIRQNMYTAINPEATEITVHDRPFAGTLFLDFFKISFQTTHKLCLTSSIRIGVLGSFSLASSLQSGLHDLYPMGWKYQIRNDLILNLDTKIEKGFISARHFELNAAAQGSIGSLNTDVGTGLSFRIGKFNPYFSGFPTAKRGTIEFSEDNIWKYWIFAEINQQFVFYNATLNGGLFYKNSPYVLKFNEMNHAITQLSCGLSCYYKQNGMVLYFTQISPEIKDGRLHRWGSIRLVRNF